MPFLRCEARAARNFAKTLACADFRPLPRLARLARSAASCVLRLRWPAARCAAEIRGRPPDLRNRLGFFRMGGWRSRNRKSLKSLGLENGPGDINLDMVFLYRIPTKINFLYVEIRCKQIFDKQSESHDQCPSCFFRIHMRDFFPINNPFLRRDRNDIFSSGGEK